MSASNVTLDYVLNRSRANEFLGDDSGGDNTDDTGTWNDPNEWTKLISGGLTGVANIFAAKNPQSYYTGGGAGLSAGYRGVGMTGRVAPPVGYSYDAGGNLIAQAGASAGAGVANLGTGLVNFISNNTGIVVILVVGIALWKSGRR